MQKYDELLVSLRKVIRAIDLHSKQLNKTETTDGRHGYSILLFSMSRSVLEKQLETRVGQCILTCPTTAVFSGIDSDDVIPLGKNLKYFGDGHQISKKINKNSKNKRKITCLTAYTKSVSKIIDNYVDIILIGDSYE